MVLPPIHRNYVRTRQRRNLRIVVLSVGKQKGKGGADPTLTVPVVSDKDAWPETIRQEEQTAGLMMEVDGQVSR